MISVHVSDEETHQPPADADWRLETVSEYDGGEFAVYVYRRADAQAQAS